MAITAITESFFLEVGFFLAGMGASPGFSG
jgi:hypothetical protein